MRSRKTKQKLFKMLNTFARADVRFFALLLLLLLPLRLIMLSDKQLSFHIVSPAHAMGAWQHNKTTPNESMLLR